MKRDSTAGATRRTVLKKGLGAATAVAVPMMAGRASAHFPETLAIDIEPDCDENTLDPSCQEVAVAVLRTTFENEEGKTVVFDPTERAVRYRFGTSKTVESGKGARPIHDGHAEDVNGDGHADLVLHFPMDETGFDSSGSVGKLIWERTESGGHGYSGTGQVTIVGQSTVSESYEWFWSGWL